MATLGRRRVLVQDVCGKKRKKRGMANVSATKGVDLFFVLVEKETRERKRREKVREENCRHEIS